MMSRLLQDSHLLSSPPLQVGDLGSSSAFEGLPQLAIEEAGKSCSRPNMSPPGLGFRVRASGVRGPQRNLSWNPSGNSYAFLLT